jgi:hypothetical protein
VLGFCRDVGILLAICFARGARLWWVVMPIAALCIAYDIRLMWIDAGRKLRGELTERERYEHGDDL